MHPQGDTTAAVVEVVFLLTVCEVTGNCRIGFIDLTSHSRLLPLLQANTVLHATDAMSALLKGDAGTNASLSMGRSCAERMVAIGAPAAISRACRAVSDVDTMTMLEDNPFWQASALHV
jgi:hypothetical protein